MRGRPLALALAALAASVLAVAAVAHGGRPAAALPLVARIVHVNVIGDRYALKAGDRVYADGSVLLGRTGRRIGTAAFACTVTRTGGRTGGTCGAVLHLPVGRITGRWPLTPSLVARVWPITGGSGLYRGARGRFRLGPTRRNGDTPFTVDLARSG